MPFSDDLSSVEVRKSRPADLPAVEALLSAASLPLEGVRECFQTFFVAEQRGGVLGAIGIELYGQTGLLRSLVVAPDRRSSGIGSALFNALLSDVRSRGVTEVILLTTTAAEYFARKGFRAVPKESIQGEVTTSPEFTGACPSTATVMRRRIGQRVLILCTGNVCRSQMAAAFLQSFDPWLEVRSAGTNPAGRFSPLTLQVMEEAGISLKNASSKSVDEFLSQSFDFVITVCDHARETCPIFTGSVGNRRHFGFEDPGNASGTEDERLAIFRATRDSIKAKFLEFYQKELLGSPSPHSRL